MEASFTNYILLLAAVAVGWLLGRSRRPTSGPVKSQVDDSSSYYKGLNFLLNEQTDEAVLTVVNDLPVRLETLPTHMAFGNLMRSKGEVEAAIRIHQNLLSRPSLPRTELHRVHLELARDYISAGLFDRAERLLRDLVDESPAYRAEGLEHLRHIYQSEKEWQQAIAVSMKLLPKRGWLRRVNDKNNAPVAVALGHYHCELAERLLDENDLRNAQRELAYVPGFDPGSIRFGLLSAHCSLRLGRANQALTTLEALLREHPSWAVDILPLFKEAFLQVAGLTDYIKALQHLGVADTSSALAVEIANTLVATQGRRAALDYLGERMGRRPTLKLLQCWLKLSENANGSPEAHLHQVVGEILSSRAVYQCRHCGFSGRKLHWLCPSCEQWGTIAPVRGTQGD